MDKSDVFLLVGIIIIASISAFSIHDWEPAISGSLVSPVLVNVYSTLTLFLIIVVTLFMLLRKN